MQYEKNDIVRFRGGTDTFIVYESTDDDIVIEHPKTGRIFSVDYRALELAPAPTAKNPGSCDTRNRTLEECAKIVMSIKRTEPVVKAALISAADSILALKTPAQQVDVSRERQE